MRGRALLSVALTAVAFGCGRDGYDPIGSELDAATAIDAARAPLDAGCDAIAWARGAGPPCRASCTAHTGSAWGSTYVHCDETVTHAAASAMCEELGLRLATVESAAEHDALIALHPASMWLGGSDQSVEGEWVWQTSPPTPFWLGGPSGMTASAGQFELWGVGEPQGDLLENCLELAQTPEGSWWIDRDCGVARRFVCERSE